MPAPTRLDDLVGAVVGDGYALEEVIGSGTASAVFRARRSDGSVVALKVVNAELAGREGSARLFREARLATQLNSPHVVPIIDSGQDAAHCIAFVAMPLLEGRTLAAVLREVGALAPAVAVKVALQAAKGLGAAHTAGVIHRDIKPSNLFLQTTRDGTITVVVCDFGIAKPMELFDDSNLTWTGHFLGSPAYMSPEQAKSAKRVDERTDVWSLGVTLYEMLCGQTPHAGAQSLSELVVAVCTRDARSIQDLAPWVPPGLAVALHRALRRNRDRRWDQVARFAHAIAPFAGDFSPLRASALVACLESVRALPAARAELRAAPGGASDLPAGGELDDDPLVGRSVGDRYRVRRLISRGGMGAVYEAEKTGAAPVAVKVIARDVTRGSSELVQRFLREASSAKSIDHPNVVRVLETFFDHDLGTPLIAMELVDGIDCATLFKRSAPMEPMALARLFVQAADGIAAAHERGIVHRDIKPANLLLRVDRSTNEITVKVADFGIAKSAAPGDESASDLTATGRLVGSPAYMSPEQALNAKAVDARTDVWSLGISLYEGLTGRRAWHGHSSLGEIILAICTESVPAIAELAPWVPEEVASVVHRALARDPAERWQTIQEMRAALAACADDSTTVLRSDLRQVDETLRAAAGPRASLGAEATGRQHSLSTMSGTARETGARRPFDKRWVLAALVLAVPGAAFGVRWLAPPSSAPPLEREAHSPAPSPSSSAYPKEEERTIPRVRASFTVDPESASVTVGGVAPRRERGRILLEGAPGQVFDVVVSKDGTTVNRRVVLTSTGQAEPSSIALGARRTRSSSIPRKAPPAAPVIASSTKPDDPLKPPPSWSAP